jgi:hypothetical protein
MRYVEVLSMGRADLAVSRSWAIKILGLRLANPGSLEDKVVNKHGAWRGSDLMQGVNCAGRPMA